MAFKMRTTKPEKGNKYYIRKASGGYSNAIKGSPTDPDCDVLSNCVGYAYGRFNEIGDYGFCKYLAPVNAENFIQYKGSCTVGQTPKLGACMVWQKGATLSGSDGAGHVAIVEKVVSSTEVVTSESGYGCSNPFWTQTRKKGSDGRWGANSSYTFLGFIYNPAVTEKDEAPVTPPTVTPQEPEKKEEAVGYDVRITISDLRIRKGPGTNYGIAPQSPIKPGVYRIVEESNGQGAKKWGRLLSGAGWIALDYATKISTETVSTHSTPVVVTPPAPEPIKAGDKVKIADNAVYYSGKTIPGWVKNKTWIVLSVNGDRAVINKSTDGKNAIMSPVNVKYLSRI